MTDTSSRRKRGFPRGGSAPRKEKLTPEQVGDIVSKVRRMRRLDLLLGLALALVVTLAVILGMVFLDPTDKEFLWGMFGTCLLAALIYTAFADWRCPHCGLVLTPSGRYSRGTLHGSACPRCAAPFELHDGQP